MNDLPSDLFDLATEALEAQSNAYDEYLSLVDAQRAALQQRDLRLMGRLSARVEDLAREIAASARTIDHVRENVVAGRVDGPRAQKIRDLLTTVAADASIVKMAVDQFTRQLQEARNAVEQRLVETADTGGAHRDGAGYYRKPGKPVIDVVR